MRLKRFVSLAAATALSASVMGMGGTGGCDTPLPSMQQITLNLPAEIRNCPNAPVSPGALATKRQIATYLIQLRSVWEVCHGNMADVNRLYEAWQACVADNGGKAC